MFEHFIEKAIKTVMLVQREAHRLNQNVIEKADKYFKLHSKNEF